MGPGRRRRMSSRLLLLRPRQLEEEVLGMAVGHRNQVEGVLLLLRRRRRQLQQRVRARRPRVAAQLILMGRMRMRGLRGYVFISII